MNLEPLNEPLREFGRRWAESPDRPRPTARALDLWDEFLANWIQSDLPLLFRKGSAGFRGNTTTCQSGRSVMFGDNSPANWSFALALEGVVPDLSQWASATMGSYVPISFVTKGDAAKRDLNRLGWKICHVDPVSDRRRYKIESAPEADIRSSFLRFMSPRNMFLIPKVLSGAGEIPVVVEIVASYDRQNPRV